MRIFESLEARLVHFSDDFECPLLGTNSAGALSLCEQFEERRVPEGIDWIVLWLFARTTAAALD